MEINAIDQYNNLFSLKNIINQNLIDNLVKEDFFSYDFETFENHETRPRRLLKITKENILNKISLDLFIKLPKISKILNVDFKTIKTVYWLDLPGYKLGPHLDDDRVHYAMQLYLWGDPIGTTFFKVDKPSRNLKFRTKDLEIRKAFDFVPNTGYLMKQNDYQVHAVVDTIMKPRLSCYSWLD